MTPSSRARRPRVVYVGHCARLSGAEIALTRLLPVLAADVDALVVLAEDGPVVTRLRDAGVRTVVLPLDPGVRDLHRDGLVGALRHVVTLGRYVVRLRRLLHEERADVVHTNTLKAALYGGLAGRLAGVPHVRDRIASDYLARPALVLVRFAARLLPTAVVANSAATIATLPGRSGTVVPDVFVPPEPQAAPGSATGPLRVGVVGRLAPWKGQDHFLRAFAHAFGDTDTRAVVVGDALFGEDAYAAGLGPLATRLGVGERVDFRGFRDDVWSELGRLDVLVHCSLTPEPFGQVVLEGMAAGLAVLTVDDGGPADLVRDGADGLLVARGDEAALTAALRRVAADPSLRRRLGAAARVRAADFEGDAARTLLLDVYQRVASPARVRAAA